MKIDSVSNTNFNSRNLQVRRLEDFMRQTQKAYPSSSVSRKMLYNSLRKDGSQLRNLTRASQKLGFIVRPKINDKRENSPNDYFSMVLECFKKYKLANCLEQTDLSSTVLGLNNITSRRASLFSKTGFSDLEIYDHVLSVIPLKEDAFVSQNFKETPLQKLKDILIYDSFCGFVDFPGKAAERYRCEFQNHIISNWIRMVSDGSDAMERLNKNIYLNFDIPQSPVMSEEVKKTLANEHPELIFKK